VDVSANEQFKEVRPGNETAFEVLKGISEDMKR
jgi:hypothetical protein